MFLSAFSVAPYILISNCFKRKIASFIWFTLQIGTLNTAPEEVLIVSPFTGALPLDCITIQSTPEHSAVLTIAPKFLTSESWARINIEAVFFFFSIILLKSSIFKNLIGAIVATTPWWFLRV